MYVCHRLLVIKIVILRQIQFPLKYVVDNTLWHLLNAKHLIQCQDSLPCTDYLLAVIVNAAFTRLSTSPHQQEDKPAIYCRGNKPREILKISDYKWQILTNHAVNPYKKQCACSANEVFF